MFEEVLHKPTQVILDLCFGQIKLKYWKLHRNKLKTFPAKIVFELDNILETVALNINVLDCGISLYHFFA